MSKLAIVYWSGTGNTESMAAMVAAGAKEAGAQVDLFTAAEFGPPADGPVRRHRLWLPLYGREHAI